MNYVSTHTYDDFTVRWASPDPAMQFSNPYLGIGNNPVMYVDPDGEFIGLAIGAAVLITNSIRSGIQTKNAGSTFMDGFMYSFVTGAASMALTAGVGTAFGSVGSVLNEVGRAGAHGLVGGGMSHITGGDFKTGFAAGAVSSVTGSLTHGMHPGVQTIASGLSGGFASTITGGKFWNGFIQGATIAAVNHIAHAAFGPGDTDPLKQHLDEAMTIDEWKAHFEGKSRTEILTEMKNGGYGSSKKGGGYRFVIDPKTGNVIDMKHLVGMGNKGRLFGNFYEEFQVFRGNDSGRNPQDYFSNELGYEFYGHLRIMQMQSIFTNIPALHSDFSTNVYNFLCGQ